MVTVTTAELKARLSKYLRLVRAGETVLVTSHGHSVAHLVPHPQQEPVSLERTTRPLSDLKEIGGVQPLKPVEALQILIEDRQRR